MPASASARVTRRSGSNFYYAFQALPRDKREAIYAVYSFCRTVDDCVDEAGGEGEAGLTRWLQEARRCYGGVPETPLGRDLCAAVTRFPIPRSCFEEIVAGCRMDVSVRRYPTYADLRLYCERVASAVGRASIEVFGYACTETRDYAAELGVALQLTNILRDLAVDAARGRIYLPLDDLDRFGVGEEQFLAAAAGRADPPGFRALLSFEAERALEQHRVARSLLPPRDRRSMAPAEIMAAVYRALLGEVVRRGFPRTPVRLSRPRRVAIALATLARAHLPA